MTIRKGVRDAASRVRGSIKRVRVRTPIDEVPSLKDFIQKKSVIHQYRSFLRAVGSIGDETYRQQGLHEVRKEFDSLKFEEDQVVISMAVQEGRRRLKDLRAIIGYQKQDDDLDSWLNIKDEDDPRGRVGVSWPWEQSNDKGDDRK